MGSTLHRVDLPIDVVYAALTDPETYPHWLVGARDIRSVEESWPAPGSRFHHRVGLIGPLKVADSSEVLEVDPPRKLVLEVRARPFGRARASFTLDGGAEGPTTITLDEVPIGPLKPLTPLLDPLIVLRNRRSLDQLDDYLRHGASHRLPG